MLSRPYLHTLIVRHRFGLVLAELIRCLRLQNYILHLHSPWSVVFYTSLTRKQAMKTLKELKLPTGSPEKDERDGVMGVFSKVRPNAFLRIALFPDLALRRRRTPG